VEGKRVLIPLVIENYKVTLLFKNHFDGAITDRLLRDRHAACRVEPLDGIFFGASDIRVKLKTKI